MNESPLLPATVTAEERLGYSPEEFAALFGRKITWGYRQLYRGQVRRLDQPGRIIIPASEVRRFASQTRIHD